MYSESSYAYEFISIEISRNKLLNYFNWMEHGGIAVQPSRPQVRKGVKWPVGFFQGAGGSVLKTKHTGRVWATGKEMDVTVVVMGTAGQAARPTPALCGRLLPRVCLLPLQLTTFCLVAQLRPHMYRCMCWYLHHGFNNSGSQQQWTVADSFHINNREVWAERLRKTSKNPTDRHSKMSSRPQLWEISSRGRKSH